MSDLIERLRQVWSNDNCTHEAADEIERLTTEVSELKGTISILTQLNEQKTDDRYDDWAFSEDGYMRRGKALRVENERLQARVEALEAAAELALRVIQSELVNADAPLTSAAIEAELMLRAATGDE